jgi:tryptophan halogenase
MRPLQTIAILGGGSAGWMTAAALAQRMAGHGLAITVVESSSIGSVGVGEATVPAFRDYIAGLGLDMDAVMAATGATVKSGIQFQDWRAAGHSYFHPFALYGAPVRGVPFHHVLAWLRQHGHPRELARFNLGTRMALEGRFEPPQAQPEHEWEVLDWALHLDAGRFARLLTDYATARGVRHLDARFEGAELDPQNGHVQALRLDGGRELAANFFIDCSGFRGLLIREALGNGFVDWRHWLPCDRAIAMPCAADAHAPWLPYTRATARPAGWQWRIPLQHRVGSGHVYASDFCSDDSALQTLLDSLEGPPLAEPNRIRFTPGHVPQAWDRNVLAIGLAGGFLEPLESTGLTLIQSAIDKFLALWPPCLDSSLAACAREFNRASTLEYERIRDFLVLHYAASARRDTAFWRHVTSQPLPDTLQHKMDLFRARGHFVRHEWETFQDPSWLSIYDGLGVQASGFDGRLHALDPQRVAAALDGLDDTITARVQRARPVAAVWQAGAQQQVDARTHANTR